MATDNSKAYRDPKAVTDFGLQTLAAAQQHGMVVVEHAVCPACGGTNTHLHNFAERLCCQFANCKQLYPSKMPRPPLRGDLMPFHYQHALGVLQAAMESMQAAGLTPMSSTEMATLSPETQVLLVRQWMTTNLELYSRVHRLAIELSENEK